MDVLHPRPLIAQVSAEDILPFNRYLAQEVLTSLISEKYGGFNSSP